MSVKSVNDIISRCKDYCEDKGWTQWEEFVDHIPNRGRGLITNDTQAACYIAAYGYSHMVKLRKMFEGWDFFVLNDDYEIFDWGCGQGLATMTFIEKVPSHILSKLRKVTLIDLSQTVLDIASECVSDIYDYQVDEWHPNDGITIKKMRCSLPTINGSGLKKITTQYSIAVHLFSNILDIRTIDLGKLAKTVISAEGKPFHQKHYILATHPGSYDPDGERMNDFIKNKYFDEGRVEIDEGCGYCHIFGYAESYNEYTTAYCDYMSARAEYLEKELRKELDIRRTVEYCDYMSRLAEQYELDDEYPYNDENPVTVKIDEYNICPYTTHNFERVGYNVQKPLKVRHDHILSIKRKYAYKGANAPYEVVVAISYGQKVFLSYMEAWARTGHDPESIEKYADLIWHKVKYPKPDKKSDDYIAFLYCPESLLKNKVEDYLERYPESDPLNDEEYFCEMKESPDHVKQKELIDVIRECLEPLPLKQRIKEKLITIRNIICLILGWVLMLFVLGMIIVFILSLFGVEIW